ncbi:jmjC domain-containing protein 8 isoform 3-T3 [Chlamydotis macqueenii]
MAAARRLLSLLLPLAWARPSGCAEPPDGGWLAGTVPEEERCTVERADASLTYSLFLQRPSAPSAPGRSCWRPSGPCRCGSARPTPTPTAKWTCPSRTTWSSCWSRRIRPGWAATPSTSSGTTTSPSGAPSSSGSGSGVPFHWHGPGYSEVIFGRKRWFLYPPDKTPHFHPNETTLAWLHRTYPSLPPAERPLECTLRPGEVLYFPDRWWHATLNLDTSVFISTFLG